MNDLEYTPRCIGRLSGGAVGITRAQLRAALAQDPYL